MTDGKMSKSKGNVVYADDVVEKYGVDALRYYFLHEIPFAADGVYSEDLLVERINSDLANILGNLVNRTISMSNKYFDGVVTNTGVNVEEEDSELKSLCEGLNAKVKEHMDKLRIADSIDDIFEVLRAANKYIDITMPWALAKDETKLDRLNTVLYNLIEAIRVSAVYLQAFLPETAEKIFSQINTDIKDYESTKEFGKYVSGTKLNAPEILFARIDIKK
jgi:methionyl-tRNA synthetase